MCIRDRRTRRPKRPSEAAWPSQCATPMRRSVRTAAAGASSLTEFLERLRDDGVVRERHSERNPGEITGYAVASPDSVDSTGKPIYYGGGKLAADLTLPELRRRWEVATPQDATSTPSCTRAPPHGLSHRGLQRH